VDQRRDTAALRRAVLTVTLLGDGVLGELVTDEQGVTGPDGFAATWAELHDGLAGARAVDLTREAARWLQQRLQVHGLLLLGGPDAVHARLRPCALPPGHLHHRGAGWVRRRVHGGALELGLALRGLDDDGTPDREAVGVLLPGVLAGLDPIDAERAAWRYLDDMAGLATERLRRDPSAVLRPLGDADVLTLLASERFRTALVGDLRMRTAAVPSRTRGWLDLGRLDPAFAVTAASLTAPGERGFDRPVLVTREEVALARVGGDAIRQSLADPAPPEPSRPVEWLS
jgi:hypothetical protein